MSERIRTRPNQIIVWVSLSPDRTSAWTPRIPLFPAVLDTGHTHGFALNETHLTQWTGLMPSMLARQGWIRDRDLRIPFYSAELWVHRNRSGTRDLLAGRSPIRLDLIYGIAVYSAGGYPRLPLIGLGAIVHNKLILQVDGARREVTLRTRRRWWPFG